MPCQLDLGFQYGCGCIVSVPHADLIHIHRLDGPADPDDHELCMAFLFVL